MFFFLFWSKNVGDKLPCNKNKASKSEAIFNLKNKGETSNNTKLSKVFDEEEDLDKATQSFVKKLNRLIYKFFKKIGQKRENNNQQEENLYNK